MPLDYDDQAEINRIATSLVEQILIAQDWEMFKITPDYRIDYDIEPRKDKSLTGHRVAVQQKGKREVTLSAGGAICGDLRVEHVGYWVDLHQRPVFLFLVDVSAKKVWWLFLQKYIIENSANLGQIKGNWRNQQTMTVHLPLNQTLDNLPLLESAIAESYQYMARLYPTSINDAIEAQIAKLKSVDPDVEVSVQISNTNDVSFILNASNPQRLFAIGFNQSGNRTQQLQQDIIEKGLPVKHEPGEVFFFGSPIFDTDWFKSMRGLQIANISQGDVYLIIENAGGQLAAEIKFPNAKMETGASELRIDGRIWEALVTVNGIFSKDATTQKMSFRIDLSKRFGHRVSDLRYFSQISAFAKATLEGRSLSIYIEHLDERHLVGTAPALKESTRAQWDAMADVLEFIENLRRLETRLHVELCVPEVFDREEFELVSEILRVTNYRSFAAPEWTASTDLRDVPEEAMRNMQSGQQQFAGTTVLKKQAQEVLLLGQTIVVPAHSYTTTHVIPKLVRTTGPHSMTVEWTGTSETVVTLAPD